MSEPLFLTNVNVLTNGAHRAGPMAKPSTKTDTPTINISELILKLLMTSLAEPEYADDANVTANTESVAMAVMNHFRVEGQFIGLV